MNTIKKNTEALLEAGRRVDPEVKPEKTKYMVVSRHKVAVVVCITVELHINN
jgi:hypothetical protein